MDAYVRNYRGGWIVAVCLLAMVALIVGACGSGAGTEAQGSATSDSTVATSDSTVATSDSTGATSDSTVATSADSGALDLGPYFTETYESKGTGLFDPPVGTKETEAGLITPNPSPSGEVSDPTQKDWAAGTGGKSVIKVGLSFPSPDAAFFVAPVKYLQQMADDFFKETGRKVEFQVTYCDWDVTKEANNVEDLMSQKLDVLVVCPQDSKQVISYIDKAHAAGMKMMTLGRNASDGLLPRPDFEVGEDDAYNSYGAAKLVLETLKAEGKELKVIDMLGDLDDLNAQNRERGVQKALAEYGIKPVAVVPTDYDNQTALTGATAALTAHQDATAIFAGSDIILPGIQGALMSVDRWGPIGDPKHMRLMLADSEPQGYNALKDKVADSIVLYDMWEVCRIGFNAIVDLADGKTCDPMRIMIKGPVGVPENADTIREHYVGKDFPDQS